ncbi:MAG TPA: prolyl oligopeptidase family serine peptidase [Steroidobacteraceae bacterium]|jgi:prolyl oligopeptidase|nr:prolyl oligopeptidase family serine peptidase [Steroidobacteraceae bacterium]
MRGHELVVVAALTAVIGAMAFAGVSMDTNSKAAAAAADPYLWLEDVHGAKALDWVKAQNARSITVLQGDPDYRKDYDAILKVLDATDRIPYGELDHQYVFNFWQDAEHPKGVWRRTTIADYAHAAPRWDVLLDLDKLSADEHENWVWKGADCTPSLKRCLLTLSRGGGDAAVVREFDPAAKSFVKGGFELAEAKSQITWLDEDTVVFGTDFGAGSMTTSGYPRIVKLWKRGEPLANARTVYTGEESDVASAGLVFHSAAGHLALIQRAVTFFTAEYFWLAPDGTTRKLPLPLGADLKGAQGSSLLFTLRDDWSPPAEVTAAGAAPGTIRRGSLIACHAQLGDSAVHLDVAVLYTPDEHSAIDDVAAGRDAVYVSINRDVTGSVHVFRRAASGAWSDSTLALPAAGSTHIVSANNWGPEAQFRFESYTTPPTLYADSGDGRPAAIKSLPARFDASDLATEQFFATSKDGTRVPYFVTRSRKLEGPAPTVLYGYGGFEISLTPNYSANFGMLWLTRGGVFVVANIRGGGEYGPAWHQAALLENRQKAYDDFQAVAADLLKRGITTAAKLGIMGGSNGGLLVSANMVERPELFGAVVCQVPLIDMIRYTHIGAGASWEAEYGDPEKPADRAWILKYSPYQNVRKGQRYPPVFFVTATSDDRVTPVHARKMAARMEAQGHDVLFFENTDGGHAAAADHRQAAEMWALSFVYLKQQLTGG